MLAEILATGMLAFSGLSRGRNFKHFVIERVQFLIVFAHTYCTAMLVAIV